MTTFVVLVPRLPLRGEVGILIPIFQAPGDRRPGERPANQAASQPEGRASPGEDQALAGEHSHGCLPT